MNNAVPGLRTLWRLLDRLLPLPKIEGYESPVLVDAIFKKTVSYRPKAFGPKSQALELF
jgi:hypothetical protein